MSERSEHNQKGDRLIKDIMSKIYQEFPSVYNQMPYDWVERLWKYCLLVFTRPPPMEQSAAVPSGDDDLDGKIFASQRKFSFMYLFKVFLEHFQGMSLPADICHNFRNQMNQGFEVVTKSWFHVSPGEVQKVRVTFLEHYLLLLREKGNSILDPELLTLLVQHTENGHEIMDKYHRESYHFLGNFV